VKATLRHPALFAARAISIGEAASLRRATSRFWSWEPNREPGRFNPMSVAGEFAERLHEAVGLQSGSTDPVGLCLSGGVDSASLAASLALHDRRDVIAYTFESEGDEARDGLASKVVSEYLKLENRTIRQPADGAPDDDEISRLAWLAEGEFSPAFSERLEIAKAARADGVGVLLNGQGIDEVLGGTWATYNAFRNAALVRHLRAEVVPSPRGWPSFSPEVLGAVGQDLSGWMGRRQEGWWAQIMSRELARDHARLSNGALRYEDRMCAAHGVEARSPFLDHPLLEFLASLPEGSRLEMFTSKRVLRAAAARVLPRNIAGRPPAVSPSWRSTMSRGVIERGADLAALLERERVEENGWFSWSDVQSMKASGDWVALDHVLILHLLDENFIRNFRAAR
jgi:asparagine synthase (glutamine-hydrolysing)